MSSKLWPSHSSIFWSSSPSPSSSARRRRRRRSPQAKPCFAVKLPRRAISSPLSCSHRPSRAAFSPPMQHSPSPAATTDHLLPAPLPFPALPSSSFTLLWTCRTTTTNVGLIRSPPRLPPHSPGWLSTPAHCAAQTRGRHRPPLPALTSASTPPPEAFSPTLLKRPLIRGD
jgi:hypothetical protein